MTTDTLMAFVHFLSKVSIVFIVSFLTLVLFLKMTGGVLFLWDEFQALRRRFPVRNQTYNVQSKDFKTEHPPEPF